MNEEVKQGKLYQTLRCADGETKRWGDGYRTFKAQDSIEKSFDEAKADLLKHSTHKYSPINMGGCLLIEKAVFEKWFGK